MVNKGVKISSIIVRATPIMEILTGFMIAGFIFFSGSLISSGELQVNQFFSFLSLNLPFCLVLRREFDNSSNSVSRSTTLCGFVFEWDMIFNYFTFPL